MSDKRSKYQIYKEDFCAALMLLTRIPVNWDKVSPDNPPDMNRSLWAYPLVGLLVGLVAALIFYVCVFASIPNSISIVLTLSSVIFITGAFHEDGLADTADGFGGGGDKQEKLDIMRDSCIGTYGALALISAFLLKVFALLELTHIEVLGTLVVAAVLSRLMIIYMLIMLKPARKDSLSTQSGKPGGDAIIFATGSALLFSGLVFDIRLIILMFLVACAVTFLFSRLARSQVGGFSGDILGASQQLTEVSIYIVAACVGSAQF